MEIHEITSEYGLTNEENTELIAYIANRFEGVAESVGHDTGFLEAWEGIISFAEMFGAVNAINTKVCPKRPLVFRSPRTVEMKIYDSFAGRIPIIYVRDPTDFEQLVTNVAYKGVRPENISQTGASFISGRTTRFIILSAKPYSNVPASELGINNDSDWLEGSMLLRRGHECTHYYTKQTYGIANNILHDEIMADFIGMYEAFGYYKAEWFLRFMGLIEGSGRRVVFYTKDLSPNVVMAVSELLTKIAYRLEEWSNTKDFKALSTAERIRIMCKKGLAGMMNAF